MTSLDKIAGVLRDILELPATSALNPALRLHDDLGMSSLQRVMAVTEAASVCDVDLATFSVRDIQSMTTVADLVALMEKDRDA